MSKITYDKALDAVTLEYRALTAADAPSYRDLRLQALETEGLYFTANQEQERARTLLQWAAACTETTKQASFGAFAGKQLIGVSSVAEAAPAIATPAAAHWKATYIAPTFRRAHVAAHLYKLREQWSKEHGYTEAVFSIRADNTRSREIQEANGAVMTRQEPLRFADGSVAPALWYKKQLAP